MRTPRRAALAVALSFVMSPVIARAQQPQQAQPQQQQGSSVREQPTASAFVPPPVPGGLTPAAVAASAAQTSFEVRARQAEVMAAAASVDQALAAYFPRLTLGASYTRLSDIGALQLGVLVAAPSQGPGPIPNGTPLINVPLNIPVLLNNTQFSATLVVPIMDYFLRLPAQQRAAEQSRDGAQRNLDATRYRAALEGRLAFYQWARALMQVRVAELAVTQAREHHVDAERLFNAGSVPRADVLRADTQLASAELLLVRAGTLVEVSAERIRIAAHLPAGAPLALGQDLLAVDEGAAASLPSLDGAYHEALSHRPELRALDAQREALVAQARATRAAYLPTVNGTAQGLVADPNTRYFPLRDQFDATWSLGVALTWSPNDVANAALGARGVDSRVASIEAQRSAQLDVLRGELAQALATVREAQASIESTTRALSSAEEGWRIRRELYRNGRATSTELTDAETDLTRVRLENANARVDARVARARLEYSLGHVDPALASR